MAVYRFRYNGPRDSELGMECGIDIVSNPIEPALTKDFDIDAQNLANLTEALSFRGWSFVAEVP